MKITLWTTSRSSQPAGFDRKRSAYRLGGQWILAVLLCLSMFTPGAAVFANVPEANLARISAAPVIDINLDLNLPISTTVTIDSSFLHASQGGILPGDLVFLLVTNVTQGTLKLNGTAIDQGSTFTQQDIDAGFLTYTAPSSVSTDGFTFHVTDGVEVSADQAYIIHINKPEPTDYPDGFQAVVESTGQITTTWNDMSGSTAPDGYLVLCAPGSVPVAPTDTTTPIDNTCTDGSGSLHVPQGVGKVTWQGLSSETTYSFVIFPYAKTDYAQNPGQYYDYFTGATPPQTSAKTWLTYSISGTVTDGTFGLMGALIDAEMVIPLIPVKMAPTRSPA